MEGPINKQANNNRCLYCVGADLHALVNNNMFTHNKAAVVNLGVQTLVARLFLVVFRPIFLGFSFIVIP